MRSFLIITLLCLAQASFAQKKHSTYFLKNDGHYVQTRDSADYLRIVSEPDSGSTLYNVNEFYKDGTTKFVGKSSRIETLGLEGMTVSYYKNGKKKFVATYVNNHVMGKAYRYYPNGRLYTEEDYKEFSKDHEPEEQDQVVLVVTVNDSLGNTLVADGNGTYKDYSNDDFKTPFQEGQVKDGLKEGTWTGYDNKFKIKFAEQYQADKLIKGSSTDSTGKQHDYTVRYVRPQYPGGVSALYRFLGNKIRYPDYAREHDIQGTVVLGFVVTKDGSVNQIKILKPVHKLIDDEALRVMALAPKWIPANYCGMPISVFYSIPLSFTLSN